jgi:RNA polymerase sigma factor (sigma-70 family)
MTSDLDLLEKFVREHSQDAFGEIVRRHLNLIYSAALRQVRSPQLAEEIAQSVFTDLACQAGKLNRATGGPPVLTAWLYAVTRRTAVDVVRKESRRRLREQIAMEMNDMNAAANEWTQIEPLLDEAMATLDETDRSAILLRYFENKSLREVGEALGASEDAAQKRVSRAVERLREFFSKRKVSVGISGLAVLISANAVQSAPIGLAAAISAAALAGTAISVPTAIATTKVIAMTALQKTLITTTVALLTGAGIYEAHQAAQLREQNQSLQQQQAEQIRQLQLERDEATNRLSAMLAENEQLKSGQDEDELLKLRGEVGMLRAQIAKSNTDLDQARKEISPMKFDLPYIRRDEWNNKGTRTPMDSLSTMLWTLKTKDETKLQQILLQKRSNSPLDVQIGISKQDWDTLFAIQIVFWGWSEPIINGHPQESATIDAILEQKISRPDGTTEPEQSVHRWFLLKTNEQWLISGAQ